MLLAEFFEYALQTPFGIYVKLVGQFEYQMQQVADIEFDFIGSQFGALLFFCVVYPGNFCQISAISSFMLAKISSGWK